MPTLQDYRHITVKDLTSELLEQAGFDPNMGREPKRLLVGVIDKIVILDSCEDLTAARRTQLNDEITKGYGELVKLINAATREGTDRSAVMRACTILASHFGSST